ncbi:MAG: beta-galactosidase [Ignavibacteriae bacterium]|nr:beta-galactosidase [Ignavibacteriota bacterium]
MFKLPLFSVLLSVSIIQINLSAQTKIDLSGTWQFQIDSLDIGIKKNWYSKKFNDTIELPGSMAENNKGEQISLKTKWTGDIVDSSFFKLPKYEKFRNPNNYKVPFWLQPKKYYVGAAWYKREINIPNNWKDQEIEIILERCHWQSTVWVDNLLIGNENSLSTPHKFKIKNLTVGKHFITFRIDNRIHEINPGVNSHSISDHTQTNWNGIIGDITINKISVVRIEQIKIYSDLSNKEIKIETILQNGTNETVEGKLIFEINNVNDSTDQEIIADFTSNIVIHPNTDTIITKYNYSNKLSLWDEFSPNIYNLSVKLDGKSFQDLKEENFGLRNITTDKTQFRINGNLTFLRGTLECAIFPITGYPPTDLKEWERIFKVAKSFGLNHIRFHSWCPPESAFDAADKIGIYLQIETASWANQGVTIGDGKPIDEYIYKESKRILNEFGNHPSFCFLLYGNEPAGNNQNEYLNKLISFWKKFDNRRLYAGAAGWPEIEENDFISSYEPRIQLWGAGLSSIINSEPPKSNYDWEKIINSKSKPIISHEIGQWCVYPNFKEIKKYNGVLYPENFEIFKSFLDENNLSNYSDEFLYASGKLQTLCYKADIEAALRTKNMGGFQLLDLHDFPGQGTALVGVLDPFWNEKGYVSSKEYSQFCNSTVPLAKFPKFIFTSNETLNVPIDVAHFGPNALENIIPTWKILDLQNKEIANGKFEKNIIQIGNSFGIGKIEYELNKLSSPAIYKLQVNVANYVNSWDFWVYPEKQNIDLNSEIKIVQEINKEIFTHIEKGGTVIITPKKGSIKNEKGGNIAVGFSSIFWNTAWTNNQPPNTLGILCNPKHPLLNEFPTQSFSNFQWWDAMSNSNAILLSELGKNIEPVVRIIDDWFTARSLGLIVEAKVGKGKIILTGIDLLTNLENRIEAKQLLISMLKYAKSDFFNPKNEIQINKILQLFNK